MIRIATPDDFPLVLEMAHKFIKTTNYEHLYTEEKLKDIIMSFLVADRHEKIILLYEDKGMVAVMATPFIFGDGYVATEVAWWVEPDARGIKVGKELMDALEIWAKMVDCNLVSMVSLDPELGKYYEKRGYYPYEFVYVKEI